MNELCKQKVEEINKVIAYSQNIPIEELDASRIVAKWYENKKRFIDAFAGNTKITCPTAVVSTMDEPSRKKIFDKFMKNIVSLGAIEVNGYSFADYLYVNYSTFFDNTVSFVPLRLEETPIAPGMKLLKTFKYFIGDEDLLRKVQDAASMCIQGTKLKGKLTISVDPLDFLTSSENNNNWRSCHALDGDYRAGNFSYMCDEVTAIAYLENENQEQVQLKMFPEGMLWNNKKWRMLVHLHPEHKIWYFGRHYPNIVPSFDLAVQKILCGAFDTNNSSPIDRSFRNLYINSRDETPYGLDRIHFVEDGVIVDSRKLIKDGSTLHYNDIVYSNVHMPRFCLGTKPGTNEWSWNRYWSMAKLDDCRQMKMIIGASVPCIGMGCDGEMTHSDEFGCANCETHANRTRCSYCGEFIFEGEETFISEWGDTICRNCHDEIIRRRNEEDEYETIDNEVPF